MPRSSKHLQQKGILQADLFAGLSPLQTRLIARRNDFEELFDGFIKMRAISYVVSPDLLLEFFDQRGYSEIEIVVGENLSEVYRKDLEQKGVEVTDRLAEYVERGVLRIFVPTRTIHTKLYILERPELVRVIQTSANLTVTAQEARRQINYAWYLDIPSGHPLLDRLNQDYQSHL
ncbi:MAG: phospholipase D family protein, partial [Chloroflexi bacterium]|nr:phospholipase D family protein [Chloroflexota bacterium]